MNINFNPGLSPADHLVFHVTTDNSRTSFIMRWVRTGFAIAITTQCLLFCFRPSGHFGLDRVQAATLLAMLLRLLCNICLVYKCQGYLHYLRLGLAWFEPLYCAFLFGALVPSTFAIVSFGYGVCTAVAFCLPAVNPSMVLPIQLALLGSVMAYSMFRVNVAYFRRVLGYLVAVGLFCAPRWFVQQLRLSEPAPFLFVLRAVLENGFVLTIAVLHQLAGEATGYERPEEGGSELGVERDLHAGEDEGLDAGEAE
jgi:hypothetical protein